MDRLSRLGEEAARATEPSEIVFANLQQADVLAQVIARSQPEERAALLRQMVECLVTAASKSPSEDHAASLRLAGLKQEIVRSMPGSDLAAYVTFREIESANTGRQPATVEDAAKAQDEWLKRLAGFVGDYPKAEDTPAALQELALISEMTGKDVDARRWYQQLAENFPQSPLASKAQGALRRMDLEGRVLALALPLLNTDNERVDAPFDIEQLRGRVVAVYFWASSDGRCLNDFSALRSALGRYRGVALLCVNMDKVPQDARSFLRGVSAPGIHVFQRQGLEGRTAVRYGVQALPALLLVGRDGRVVSRSVEVGKLDEALNSQLKEQEKNPIRTVGY